jgi:hypothetical protein
MTVSELRDLFCDQIKNSSAKIVFYLSFDMYQTSTVSCRKSGIKFQERVLKFPTSFALYPHADIYKIFDETFQLLISSGIALYHSETVRTNFKFKDEEKEPKVLSCDDLSFGFIVWLVACGISIVAFALEISFELMLKILKIITKNFVGLYLILVLLQLRLVH